MAITNEERLRSLVGDQVAPGDSDEDAMFSDEKIVDMLTAAGGDLNQAALAAWRLKAAEYANLVDVTEGNASRAMSDLHKNALAMAKHYSDLITSPIDPTLEGRTGRVVIGTIQRAGRYR